MSDLTAFHRMQIVGAFLVGISVTTFINNASFLRYGNKMYYCMLYTRRNNDC